MIRKGNARNKIMEERFYSSAKVQECKDSEVHKSELNSGTSDISAKYILVKLESFGARRLPPSVAMGPDVDKEVEEELQHLEEQDDGHAQVEAQRAAKAGNQDAELKRRGGRSLQFCFIFCVCC